VTQLQALRIANRRSVGLVDIPVVPVSEAGRILEDACLAGWRIVALFGMPEGSDRVRITGVISHDERGQLAIFSTFVAREYASLSLRCRQASRFEREIAEQCGVTPVGHPHLNPVRRHRPDHAPSGWLTSESPAWTHRFSRISGDEVHEVAVGPVHAGIIEPGHFRLQAHGEEVLSLEIMLGYQHRGVEVLLETLGRDRAIYVAESIAGDSVIAHTSAWCGAVEALARSRKSARAQTIRGIALELERLANHVGDLGALSSDVAFQPAAAYFGRMRGECLNLLMLISGNRYGRGLIRPGGAGFDIDDEMARETERRIEDLDADFTRVADLFFGTASVQSRLEGVGTVSQAACIERGFVGPVARACEIPRDVRHNHPYGVFRFAQVPVATAFAGDVYSRALVRRLEIERSIEFVIEQVRSLPKGEVRAECGALAPGELVVALEEGWRGEVAHIVVTNDDGSIRRHKVVDPSFKNWPAIELAMPGNQMSDFPLCNKSFNLSYAGHDL
jgi:Ni,Fe-hydrogenase III large subunit